MEQQHNEWQHQPYTPQLLYCIQAQWEGREAELISSSREGVGAAFPGFCSLLLPPMHAEHPHQQQHRNITPTFPQCPHPMDQSSCCSFPALGAALLPAASRCECSCCRCPPGPCAPGLWGALGQSPVLLHQLCQVIQNTR